MTRTPIKINQIWRNKISNMQVIVTGKKGSFHWKCKVLTDKPDVYNGSHTMSQWILWKRFELIK